MTDHLGGLSSWAFTRRVLLIPFGVTDAALLFFSFFLFPFPFFLFLFFFLLLPSHFFPFLLPLRTYTCIYLAIFSDLVPQHGLGLCRSAGAQPFEVANQDHLLLFVPHLFLLLLSLTSLPLTSLPLTSLPLTSLPLPHCLYLTASTSLPLSQPIPSQPCLALPYLTLPYLTLPYLTLPHLTYHPSSPIPALPCLALPCLALPYLPSFLSRPIPSYVSFFIRHLPEYIVISSDVLREESWP